MIKEPTMSTTPEAVPLVDRTHGQFLLREMLRIRRLEEKSAELYSSMKIRGFLHLYIGEEAVAVGVAQALSPADAIIATYREHGQALARGMSMEAILAEMYGKVEGCARGRGGSMHLFDKTLRFFGGNAIVGGGLPLAIGVALADKMQDRPNVTCCFFGDGAAAEGEFHESLNLAALWHLPVLFVCENNQYAMGTALRYSHAETNLSRKAAVYPMDATPVNGMDVLEVESMARQAVERIRAGQGPQFLECHTYRFRAHSMFDAELYREKEEVEMWKQRDPIERLAHHLRQHELLTDEEWREMAAQVEQELDAAVAFAEAGSWEPVSELTRFVYSDGRVA